MAVIVTLLIIVINIIKFDENCHHYSLIKTADPITTKFCTYQDSCAVLVWSRFGCDQTDMTVNTNDQIGFEISWQFYS